MLVLRLLLTFSIACGFILLFLCIFFFFFGTKSWAMVPTSFL